MIAGGCANISACIVLQVKTHQLPANSCDSSACQLCHCQQAIQSPEDVSGGDVRASDLSCASSDTNCCSLNSDSARQSAQQDRSSTGHDVQQLSPTGDREQCPMRRVSLEHTRGRRKRQRMSPTAAGTEWLAPLLQSRMAGAAGSCSHLAALGRGTQSPQQSPQPPSPSPPPSPPLSPPALEQRESSSTDEHYVVEILRHDSDVGSQATSADLLSPSTFVQVCWTL